MAYLFDANGYQLLDSAGFILVDSEHLYLVTDRTAADVQRVLDLLAKKTLTEAEKEEWLSGMKGAYNYIDLNRVEGAVVYVADRLQDVGWVLHPDVKLDWTVSDFPTASEMERYLDNIRLLRSALPVGIPEVPANMDRLSYETANVIERILLLLDGAVSNILQNQFYSNEVYSGEV